MRRGFSQLLSVFVIALLGIASLLVFQLYLKTSFEKPRLKATEEEQRLQASLGLLPQITSVKAILQDNYTGIAVLQYYGMKKIPLYMLYLKLVLPNSTAFIIRPKEFLLPEDCLTSDFAAVKPGAYCHILVNLTEIFGKRIPYNFYNSSIGIIPLVKSNQAPSGFFVGQGSGSRPYASREDLNQYTRQPSYIFQPTAFSVTYTPEEAVTASPVSVTVSVKSEVTEISQVYYKTMSGTTPSCPGVPDETFTATTNSEFQVVLSNEGNWFICTCAKDLSGSDLGCIASGIYTIDLTPPVILITAPENNSISPSKDVTVSWEYDAAIAGFSKVTVDCDSDGTAEAEITDPDQTSYTCHYPGLGNYTITLKIFDQAENFAENATYIEVAKVLNISLGAYFSMALLTNGKVYIWGNNYYGQLGLGDTTDRHSPTLILKLAHFPVSGIGTGAAHACAILLNHTVYCWGYNGAGQLGLGDTTDRHSPTPVTALDGKNVTQIVGGGVQISETPPTNIPGHSCALLENHTVYCWGHNAFGQLGLGDTTERHLPTPVTALDGKNVTQIATGWHHTCAVLYDGTVYCWGYNNAGQLGLGDTTDRHSPTPVTALNGKNVTQIATGGAFTCALLDNGTVYCWGNNDDGQLGVGDTTERHLPTPVTALDGKNVTQIVTGGYHTCALLDNGTVYCWGRNNYGQLGLGDTTDRYLPTPVTALDGKNVTQIAAGWEHTCALLDNGTVYCWGRNLAGQLGLGDTATRTLPTPLPFFQ